MSNVTKKDLYVLKFIREDPELANDQNALCAKILESEGFWDYPNLFTALRSCTSIDSIKRSHRALRENDWIKVDKAILRKNMKQMNKVRDERGNANIHAIKKNIEKPDAVVDSNKWNDSRFITANPVQTSLPLEEKNG